MNAPAPLRHDAASHGFRESNLDFFIPPPQATYDWRRQAIEQRLLFAGGRFTKVKGLLAGLLALFCTGATYGLLLLIPKSQLAAICLRRGPTPYAIVFLFWWSLTTLFLKWQKLRLQRRLLDTLLSPIGEQLSRLGHKLLLLGSHLARMDAEMAHQLGRRSVALGGRQGHLGLKRRPEYSSLPGHHPAADWGASQPGSSTLSGRQKSGVHLRFLSAC